MTQRYRRGHLYRRGRIWWLKYMVHGKLVRESLGTESKVQAEALRAQKMRPLLAAEEAEALAVLTHRLATAKGTAAKLADAAAPPLALKDAWTAYMESENRPHRAGPRTLEDYEGHLSTFTAWLKERHPEIEYLCDVTPEDAAAYIQHLTKKKLSGNRLNKTISFLKTFFRVLAKPARMTVNPFGEIARREQRSNTKRPFTIEELKKIIENARGEMQTLLMLGTFTGLRLGDAATLRWDETDLDREIIRRIPRKTARTGEPVILGIPPILRMHLAALPRKEPYVIPGIAALYERNARALVKQVQNHLKNCGIETTKPGSGPRAVVVAGFHSLRHTFVSLHAQAGTPQAVLQKLAGHGNPIMTEHYTHISEDTARATAAALPPITGEPTPKALPPEDIASRVGKLADRLNAKTWKQVKEELMELAGPGNSPGRGT